MCAALDQEPEWRPPAQGRPPRISVQVCTIVPALPGSGAVQPDDRTCARPGRCTSAQRSRWRRRQPGFQQRLRYPRILSPRFAENKGLAGEPKPEFNILTVCLPNSISRPSTPAVGRRVPTRAAGHSSAVRVPAVRTASPPRSAASGPRSTADDRDQPIRRLTRPTSPRQLTSAKCPPKSKWTLTNHPLRGRSTCQRPCQQGRRPTPAFNYPHLDVWAH